MGLDFSSARALFNAGFGNLGISDDLTNNSPWISGWNNTLVRNYDMSGKLLVPLICSIWCERNQHSVSIGSAHQLAGKKWNRRALRVTELNPPTVGRTFALLHLCEKAASSFTAQAHCRQIDDASVNVNLGSAT